MKKFTCKVALYLCALLCLIGDVGVPASRRRGPEPDRRESSLCCRYALVSLY